MLGEYVALSAAGFAVPFAALAIAWRFSSVEVFSVITLAFATLTYAGMGETIPLFGVEVVGGSTYLPAMYLSLALAVKSLGVYEARRVLVTSSLGLLLLASAQFLWLLFAEYAPALTTHAQTIQSLPARNAALTLLLLYFGGLLLLAAYRSLEGTRTIYRITIPVLLDILLTTPISLITVYWSADRSTLDWDALVVHTLCVRLVLPLLVIPYIYYTERGNVSQVEREPNNITSRTGTY